MFVRSICVGVANIDVSALTMDYVVTRSRAEDIVPPDIPPCSSVRWTVASHGYCAAGVVFVVVLL